MRPQKGRKTVSPVTSVRTGCGRCRADATADPCGPCPLYGAYLERFELADEPAVRAAYDRWARRGGWPLLWKLHEPGLMRARLVVAMNLMDAYRGVDPAIVAHHLGVS